MSLTSTGQPLTVITVSNYGYKLGYPHRESITLPGAIQSGKARSPESENQVVAKDGSSAIFLFMQRGPRHLCSDQ